ncbi:MAG: glycosyltransferase family 4 protein [Victivallales bacterium]|nr:glycosyltransferase family 4 protein [Victivallales bacterium]
MKKILMLPRYSALGASSRYRFYKYIMPLLRYGYDVEVSPFFDDAYLKRLYAGEKVSFRYLYSCYYRRLKTLWHSEPKLLIEYELLPFFPWPIERYFLRRKKYLLNFDDNVWEKYRRRCWLRHKYDHLTAGAAGVIVANEYLYRKVRRLNDNVIKVPTALDPEPYREPANKFARFTLVWIGTPVTYSYIGKFAPMFQELARHIDYELLIVARRELEAEAIPGVNMRFLDWSEEEESRILPQAHVGIMPLTRDAFSRGKSAFKILQYFAAGLPVVASPVGENRHVITDGKNGFLAPDTAAWVQRIIALHDHAELYRAMAAAAAESADEYSLQTWIPEVVNFIERTFRL